MLAPTPPARLHPVPSPLATLVGESFCARQRLHAERWPGGECVAVEGVILGRLPGAEQLQVAFATPFAPHPIVTAAAWYGDDPFTLWLPEGAPTVGAIVTGYVAGMAAPIDAVASADVDDASVQIHTVDDAARRDDYLQVVLGFGLPDDVAAQLFPLDLFTADGVEGLIGYVDGEPAVATWAHACGSVLGLYGVLTVPQHRGRGLLRAIVARAARSEVAGSCIHVVAQTAGAEAAFERLGFAVVTRYTVVEIAPGGGPA
jgi:hypothetical protein